MPKVSAGILLYRKAPSGLEVLLGHPGGPAWKHKDLGAWTIPKGGVNPGEELLAAALREFEEEVGTRLTGEPIMLGSIRQNSGKTVHAFGIEGTLDTRAIRSISTTMEWPPRSGKIVEFPELDRAEFFPVAKAKYHVNPAQIPLIEALVRRLK